MLLDLAKALEVAIRNNEPIAWNAGHDQLVLEMANSMLDIEERPSSCVIALKPNTHVESDQDEVGEVETRVPATPCRP